MSSLESFKDAKSYHILAYGTLLGSNLFQTFLNGPVAFKVLPRPQFSTLQQAIFPPYFAFQSALPVVLALTWPGEKVAAAAGFGEARRANGFQGLMNPDNMWTALVPIGLMFVTSVLNMLVLGPATTKVMRPRKHQGMLLLTLLPLFRRVAAVNDD